MCFATVPVSHIPRVSAPDLATEPSNIDPSVLRNGGVWPDVAVEEGNLTKGVFTLRQVFETGDEQGYIETVPKRGYRFTAPVSVAPEQPSPISPTPSSPVAEADNSIGVMPFTDMSAARDHEYFCEGMTEEIINALGRSSIRSLQPAMASGSFQAWRWPLLCRTVSRLEHGF